ncbi:MAG: SIS domain-containing protein [Candidatus Helarchaeota archaeon]
MNYKSTTQKEIFEEPQTIEKTISQHKILEDIVNKIAELNPSMIIITGSGTSYNAGLATMYFMNKYVKIPTYVVHAAEFEYLIDPILKENQLIICLSQSGESVTTLKACKISKNKSIPTIGITAHPNSTLGTEVDLCLPILSGEEKSVMATKTYVAQLSALFAMGLKLSYKKEIIDSDEYKKLYSNLTEIPKKLLSCLPELDKKTEELSKYYKFVRAAFILGSGADYATATEGALKLKEGSRIFAQSYSTDEFRHGPITLADETVLIIGIIPQDSNKRRIMYKLFEIVKERHTSILGITTLENNPSYLDTTLKLPSINEDFNPILSVVPLQLLANHIALQRGYDPDHPRFLTKIVLE